MIKSDGSEVHVLVSKAFKVTGTETGRRGGPPPGATAGQAQPSGQAPPTSGSTSSS